MAALADDDQPLAAGSRRRGAVEEQRPRSEPGLFGLRGRRLVRGAGGGRRGEERGEGGCGPPANPRAGRGDGDGLRPAAASGGLRGATPPA